MKKVVLITSVDYEVFGDGSGDVSREQIERTSILKKIADRCGVKLTIMFEYAQFLAYNKFSYQNKKLAEDNEKIKNQLISLIRDGHDVQLHYHAQWEGATYDKVNDKFELNINHVDISSLPYNIIVKRLKEGKLFLENLLIPYSPKYQCIGFRAGSWAVKDQEKLLRALKEAEFQSDTSVVPNTKFESEQVKFEYQNCPHQYHYWFVDKTLEENSRSRNFLEVPIYTKKTPFAFLKYFNSKYFISRKIVSRLYKTKISEQNFSFLQKIQKIISRNYYMADLNTMSYKTLIKMFEDVMKDNQFSSEKIIPLMLISHSKTSYAIDDISLFFDYLKKTYPDQVEFWTYQKTILYLIKNNLEKYENISVRLIKTELLVDFTLPILGKEKYLKCKSDEYGWFVNNNCAIAFFIDKRAIFRRLVFTTSVICKTTISSEEKEFLDSIVDYVKEHKLCDFIYKAQSNVIFNFCPKDSDCVPWGTYEVDIDKSEKKLFASFNAKARNAIRKALKEGVIVERTQDVSLVVENIKNTLLRQQSIHYPSLEYVKSLQNNLEQNVVFLVAKKELVIQGSLILIYDKDRGYAMYAGSIKSPITGSLDLLHFEAMKFLAAKDIKVYDFVGTRINIKKNSKQEGIDRFKRKFNPALKTGFTFRTIINKKKYLLYKIVSKLYFGIRGYNYTDPISEIENTSKQKILLMGPLYNRKDSELIGGTMVLFEDLLIQLKQYGIKYTIIDTNKKNYKFFLFAYLIIYVQFMYKFFTVTHISLHSSRDYIVLGPLILIFGKLFCKRTSLRKFGGEASKTIEDAGLIQKYYLTKIFTMFDTLYMETKYLVKYFSKINKCTFWFPNVRERKIEPKLPRRYNKKFVFISHVIREKGIQELIEAADLLDETYIIDIYGPLLYDNFVEEDFKFRRISYKGVLKPNQVLKKLNEYDIVILPSYKEGYPGIIIEAYSLGIPVIATSLESIKEIVDIEKTGLLVEPKSVDDLVHAIQFFNNENYVYMSQMAYKKFDDFESNIVTQKFITSLFS